MVEGQRFLEQTKGSSYIPIPSNETFPPLNKIKLPPLTPPPAEASESTKKLTPIEDFAQTLKEKGKIISAPALAEKANKLGVPYVIKDFTAGSHILAQSHLELERPKKTEQGNLQFLYGNEEIEKWKMEKKELQKNLVSSIDTLTNIQNQLIDKFKFKKQSYKTRTEEKSFITGLAKKITKEYAIISIDSAYVSKHKPKNQEEQALITRWTEFYQRAFSASHKYISFIDSSRYQNLDPQNNQKAKPRGTKDLIESDGHYSLGSLFITEHTLSLLKTKEGKEYFTKKITEETKRLQPKHIILKPGQTLSEEDIKEGQENEASRQEQELKPSSISKKVEALEGNLEVLHEQLLEQPSDKETS